MNPELQEYTFNKEMESSVASSDNEKYIFHSKVLQIMNLHKYCSMLEERTYNIVVDLDTLTSSFDTLVRNDFNILCQHFLQNSNFYQYLQTMKAEMATELELKDYDIREGINDTSFAPFRKYLNAYRNKYSVTSKAEIKMHKLLCKFFAKLTEYTDGNSYANNILENAQNVIFALNNLKRAKRCLLVNAGIVDEAFLNCSNRYWDNFNLLADLTNISNEVSDLQHRTNGVNKNVNRLTQAKEELDLKLQEMDKNILELQGSSTLDEKDFRILDIKEFIENKRSELDHCNVEKLFHLEQISKLKFVIDTSDLISMVYDDSNKSDVHNFVKSLEHHKLQIDMFFKQVTEKLSRLQAKLNSTDDNLSKFLLKNIGEVNKRQEEFSQLFNQLNETMDETPEFYEQIQPNFTVEQLRISIKQAAKWNINCETKLGALKQNYQLLFKTFMEIKDNCEFIFSIDDVVETENEESKEHHEEEYENIGHTPIFDRDILKDKIAELKAKLVDRESLLKTYEELQEKIMHHTILIEPYKKQLQSYEAERKNLLGETEDIEKELEVKNLVCAALLGHQNRKQKIHHVVQLQNHQRELLQRRNLLVGNDIRQTKYIEELQMELSLAKAEHQILSGESPSCTPTDSSSLSKSSSLKTLTSSEASLSSIPTDSSSTSMNHLPKSQNNKLPSFNLTIPRSPFDRSPSKTRYSTGKSRRSFIRSPKKSPIQKGRRGQSLGPTHKTSLLGRPSTGRISSNFKSYQKKSPLRGKSFIGMENSDKGNSLPLTENTPLLNVTFSENSPLPENFPLSENCSLPENSPIPENFPLPENVASLEGESPSVVSKSQSIVEKAPLLVGKSPSLVRNSPLRIGRTSILMKSPSLDLTIPESPFEDESPKTRSCTILVENKNISLANSPIRVSGKIPKRVFKSPSLSLTVPKSQFSECRTMAKSSNSFSENTFSSPVASPTPSQKTTSPSWELTVPVLPFHSPRKINSLRSLDKKINLPNTVRNDNLPGEIGLETKCSLSGESGSAGNESPKILRKQIDSPKLTKSERSTTIKSETIVARKSPTNEEILHSSCTESNPNSITALTKASRDISKIPTPTPVLTTAPPNSPLNIVDSQKLTRSRHSKSKIPVLGSPLQSPMVLLRDLTIIQHSPSLNLENANLLTSPEDGVKFNLEVTTNSGTETVSKPQLEQPESPKRTKCLLRKQPVEENVVSKKPESKLPSLCKRFGKFESPKISKP